MADKMISELSDAELDIVAAGRRHGTDVDVAQANVLFQTIEQHSSRNTNTATATSTGTGGTATASAGNQTATQTATQSNTATVHV